MMDGSFRYKLGVWYKVKTVLAAKYRGCRIIAVAASIGAASLAPTVAANTHHMESPSEYTHVIQSVDTTLASIRYLANEGVLVRLPEGTVLIDGLFGDGLKEYPVVEPATRDSLEQALGEFAAIDVVLITHVHSDHFDAEAVERHMLANPTARLVAPQQVVDAIQTDGGMFDKIQKRMVTVDSSPGYRSDFVISGVRIRAFGVSHPPSRTEASDHLVYVIGEVKTVAHLGDISLDSEGIESLKDAPPIRVLLTPYWIVGVEGVRRLQELVDATCLAGFHVALGQEERIRNNLEKTVPDVVLLTGQPAKDRSLDSCFH